MLLVNFIVTKSKSVPNQSYDIFVPKLTKIWLRHIKKQSQIRRWSDLGLYQKNRRQDAVISINKYRVTASCLYIRFKIIRCCLHANCCLSLYHNYSSLKALHIFVHSFCNHFTVGYCFNNCTSSIYNVARCKNSWS